MLAWILMTGFAPALVADRDGLRAQLGYAPEEKVCIVSVGGSGVGEAAFRDVKWSGRKSAQGGRRCSSSKFFQGSEAGAPLRGCDIGSPWS